MPIFTFPPTKEKQRATDPIGTRKDMKVVLQGTEKLYDRPVPRVFMAQWSLGHGSVLSSSDPRSCLEMERCGEDASMSLSPWHLLLLPTHCPLDRCVPLIGSHTSICTSCTNKHRSESICRSQNDELKERETHTASEAAWRTPPCL